MNRLIAELPLPKPIGAVQQTASTASPTVDSEPGVVVFAPLHYEPNYAYPLVVWLHAEGRNEQDLSRVIPRISMRNYVAVAPRGTLTLPSASMTDGECSFGWSQSTGHILNAQQRILSALRQAKQYNIHAGRVFLVGQGCGGSMALRLAMTMPELFRGVASLDGPFPTNNTPLSRLPDVRRLDVMLAAARQGGRHPSSSVCRDLRLLHVAGIDVTLREYPDNDILDQQIPGDIDRWIMDVVGREQQASVIAS